MKELSIEEKAKRFDEALHKAKRIINVCVDDNTECRSMIACIQQIFPELKESEDEQHRKWILEYLYDGLQKSDEQFKDQFKCAIAWFEKQGEHANFLNKIKIGDKVTRNKDGVLVNLSQLKRVAKKDEKQGENNMGISEATKKKLEDNLNKALEKETPESCNEFLEKQSEQKPWSKEDEDNFNSAIYYIRREPYMEKTIEPIVDWLESLKDRAQSQNTWKPSEEQMKALWEVYKGGEEQAALASLYSDLKKLKE